MNPPPVASFRGPHAGIVALVYVTLFCCGLFPVTMFGGTPSAHGEHKVRIVLVDATHNPFPGQEVTLRFTIPEEVPVSHSH